MRFYFINTDAKSLGGKSPHDKWFHYGCAFTGGPFKYGKKLGRFSPDDFLLMYANRIGVVGVGLVRNAWDGLEHRPQLVYVAPHEDTEYRIPVDWFLDLRKSPITPQRLRELIGWNPVGAVQAILNEDAQEIRDMIEKIQEKSTSKP